MTPKQAAPAPSGIRTETMARLLLEQGHRQEARRIILALLDETPASREALTVMLREIDAEHPEISARDRRQKHVRRAQHARLTAMFERLTEVR
ncbi:MAG: hypothetical protein JW781_11365 [Deltaproteobacteria bacterium]|nr:hypothetical protein [Candidatus Anaeroferrophillacea bacterium]